MKRFSFQVRAAVLTSTLLASCAVAASAAAPVVRDDYAVATDRYLTTEGGVETYSILIDVLANDEDADGEPLEVVIQGGFGGPPAIWTPSPVGTVQYLGAGLFDLSFGKEELGEATEVTFQYELEGATSPGTVHVSVSGTGPAPEVIARNDELVEQGACWIRLPVLANDTGLDLIESFTQPVDDTGQPVDAVVQRDPAEPHVLVYRGRAPGSFAYSATSSLTGASASATVTVNGATSTPHGNGEIKMADCFSRDDGVGLGGQTVGYYYDNNQVPHPSWTATGVTHLDRSVTHSTSLPGGSSERRKGYLPFDGDGGIAAEGTAVQIEGTFQASSTSAEWVALAFTHGSGSVFSESDLWVRLDAETGELFLNGRWDPAAGLNEQLGAADPATDGYTFVKDGVNHLRLRLNTAPVTPWVDVWINGTRAISEPFDDDQGNPVGAGEITGAIENAGFFLNYGTNSASPGDVWFDDFELWVGDVYESVLLPKAGDPGAQVDVENGSTLSMGPLHVGCTPDHSNCHPSQETSLLLTNDGNEALEVTNLSFEGGTEWTLVEPSAPSFSVPAGGEQEVRVRVDALEVGSTVSRLELTTNDDDLPKLVLQFAGTVTQAPVAAFVHYCDALTCSFDAGSSTGESLTDNGHAWFLDGQFRGFGSTLDHTFSASGVHTVDLKVTDATDAQHVLQRTVSVAPEASFTAVCSNAARTCDFDAVTSTDGIVSYLYDFGDGTSRSEDGDPGAVVVQHAYATSGRYDVTLVVQDGDGQEASVTHEVTFTPVPDFLFSCSPETLICNFDASSSTPLMTHYEWRLGDGSLAVGQTVAHDYATSGLYPVTLIVVDQAGQIDAVSKTVPIPPRADFSVTCDPDLFTCSFDGSTSTPGVGHSWDFGDGSPTASGPLQEHAYGTSGTFTATLTVTDSAGQTASSSRQVVLLPKAFFTVSCDSLRCRFDGSGSSPGVVSYSWDFGDGTPSGTGESLTHDFQDAGDYSVLLSVTDSSGQTASAVQTVTVFDEELFLLILLDRR